MVGPRVVFNKKTGRYEPIRQDFRRGILESPYTPGEDGYKTERGYRKKKQREYDDKMAELDEIERASAPEEFDVTVEWSKDRIYGRQATATVDYTYLDENGNPQRRTVVGDKTKGTGYDKKSTAVANAWNKSPEFRKILVDARARGEKVPYGATLEEGEPYMPRYDRGVGMSSLDDVMRERGYERTFQKSGENFDVYQYRRQRFKDALTPKKKRRD